MRSLPRALRRRAVSLLLAVLSLAALPPEAFAAKNGAKAGEACGQLDGWSQSCERSLKCDVKGGGTVGICVDAARRCGGLLGAPCGAGEYCDYAIEALCGAADQTGVCKPRPSACSLEYKPVCGCDDRTYPNACAAQARGVSVAKSGACDACEDDGTHCQEPVTCEYDGKTHEVGDAFPAKDGCNSCRCDASGTVQCTLKLCGGQCDEPGKRYVLRDPQQCRAILFNCQNDGKPFFDGCGCGCQGETKPPPPPAKRCVVGGCSGQICSDAAQGGAISTCEWREEYACYRGASCAVQASGQCGWTQTPELRACLGR